MTVKEGGSDSAPADVLAKPCPSCRKQNSHARGCTIAKLMAMGSTEAEAREAYWHVIRDILLSANVPPETAP